MWDRYEEILVFLYAMCSAMLPIPSSEVVTIPMILAQRIPILPLTLIVVLGSLLGDVLAYSIAYSQGPKFLMMLAEPEEVLYGQQMMERFGVWSIFAGPWTTIPSFLISYLAGMIHMDLPAFLVLDALARFARCLLACAIALALQWVMDAVSPWQLILLGVLLFLGLQYLPRWIRNRLKSKRKGLR